MNQNQKLYVGNLNFAVTEEDIQSLFGTYGKVEEVKIITDRYTGRPRGFAFVKMADVAEAQKAKDELNGQSFQERNLIIDWASADHAGSRGNGGGGGGGGGGQRRSFGGGGGGGGRGERSGGERGGYHRERDRG